MDRSAAPAQRTNPAWLRLVAMIAVVGAVLMLVQIALHGYRAYRFDRYARTADAQILDSDLGCIVAMGGGSQSAGSGSITYRVRFPTPDGPHTTDVIRPCHVVPPDFGRGRGAIWIEYLPQDPDQVRVVNDRTDRDAVIVLVVVLALYPVIFGIVVLVRRYLPGPPEPPAG